MHVTMIPVGTGSGHNMRAYALAEALRREEPDIRLEVYLTSLQDTFGALFTELEARVVDMAPDRIVNHSDRSHLSARLDWATMLEGYLEPTFFNSRRILRLVRLLQESPPDVVVADYDFSAAAAAAIVGVPYVLVTERHNFTIVSVDNSALEHAGFEINGVELASVREVLDGVFAWTAEQAAYVLTDKPFVEELDRDTRATRLMEEGKMRFVGPMIRPLDGPVDSQSERARFGFGEKDFLIVAAMGGTSMFRENMLAMQQTYLEAYRRVRERVPEARMVLISREATEVSEEGVFCTPYVPKWIPLIRSADLLLVHPGWITVTEISALGTPAIFALSSPKEYHELEAYERLKRLGYAVHMGSDPILLSEQVVRIVTDTSEIRRVREAYKAVAPNCDGARRAALLIRRAAGQHAEHRAATNV